MTDPVTEAGRALLDHEMGDRDVPGNDLYLSADEVRAAIIAIEQEAAALARAEAGVSAAVEALADVRARRSTFATAEAFDSAMLEAAWNILAARSAGSGSRVERDGVTEAMQRNDFLHVLDLALASNGHPGLPVAAILRDIEAGGYTYRLSDRALALARPTPPPAVEWCQWRSPSGSGCPFPPDHEVHDEERARAAGRRFHPLIRPTPPAPDPDRLQALEAALREFVKAAELDIPTPRVYKAMQKARALLADGERSDG